MPGALCEDASLGPCHYQPWEPEKDEEEQVLAGFLGDSDNTKEPRQTQWPGARSALTPTGTARERPQAHPSQGPQATLVPSSPCVSCPQTHHPCFLLWAIPSPLPLGPVPALPRGACLHP